MIHDMKIKTSLEELCQYCPNELIIYTEYCRKLNFEEEPDYDFLISLFKRVMKREEIDIKQNENEIFDWQLGINEDEERMDNIDIDINMNLNNNINNNFDNKELNKIVSDRMDRSNRSNSLNQPGTNRTYDDSIRKSSIRFGSPIKFSSPKYFIYLFFEI